MATVEPRPVSLRDGRPALIRSAEPDDAPAVLALSREVACERGWTVFEPDEVDADPGRLRERIDGFRSRADAVWLVALDEQGRLLGELDCRAGRPRRLRHRARLGVNVGASARGNGVGTALIAATIAWARAHPTIEKLTLGVMAENAPAVALYRSLGFIEEGRRTRELRLGPGRYADDLVMALFVKP